MIPGPWAFAQQHIPEPSKAEAFAIEFRYRVFVREFIRSSQPNDPVLK